MKNLSYGHMEKKSFGVSFSIHPNIKFSREVNQNMTLSFSDVLVIKIPDGSLKYTVYHTDAPLRSHKI
jgi:hypothetical protein